jgi:hypothetical protein
MAEQASQELKDAVYRRAAGKCECEMTGCGHQGRCTNWLRPGWGVRCKTAGGEWSLTNAFAACKTCNESTPG